MKRIIVLDAVGAPATARPSAPLHAPMRAALPALLLALALALLPGAAAQAQPALGRLFTTPQQRAELDAQRRGAAQPPAAPVPSPAAPVPPPPPPPPLVLNGVLRPSGGRPTVWLNQRPEQGRVVRRDGQVTLSLPSGRSVTLKPGQQVDEVSGEVRDGGQ